MPSARLFVQPQQKFGDLTVVNPETRKGDVRAASCICSCGTANAIVPVKHLVSGRVRSCGCLRRVQLAKRNQETASRGGLTRHPLYSTWAGIINRCYSPAAGNYRWYGARDVKVWEGWRDDPAAFITYIERELGPRPVGMSLDRIDPNADYAPGKLKWSTALEQARNRRARSA